MKRYLKNISLFFIIPLLVTLAVFLIADNSLEKRTDNSYKIDRAPGIVGEVSEGVTIEQRFVCKTFEIPNIELMVATYARANSGDWIIRIVDNKQKAILGEQTIQVNKMLDNKFVKVLIFPSIKKITSARGWRGRELSLIITSTSPAGASATIYKNSRATKGRQLLINGKKTPGELVFKLKHRLTAFQFLDRVTQFKPAFVKGRLFYAINFIFVFGVAFWMVKFACILFSDPDTSDIIRFFTDALYTGSKKARAISWGLITIMSLALIDTALVRAIGGVSVRLSLFRFSSTGVKRPLALFVIALVAFILFRWRERRVEL